MTKPVITIATPTYNREALLRRQHETVVAQSEQNFEWRILDDSPEPSAYFQALSDPRIHYTHHAGPKLSIGAKRNRLAEDARADVIAHFDDDDYYAPGYLTTMLARIAAGADITKLSGWFVYTALHGFLGYWNTAETRGMHFLFGPEPLRAVMLTPEQSKSFETHYAGFGFSYVYRKAVWEETRFPDQDFNEDFTFVSGAMAHGRELDHFPDRDGLCLHMLRRDNISTCFPQFVLPAFLVPKLFPGMGVG